MPAYRPREIVPLLTRALASMPVVVLTGMRQVGKTTLLRRDPSLKDRRYLTLDDFDTEAAARSDPASLVAGTDPVTIDEVQRAPDLLRAIQAEVDRDRRPGRFLLSGSANLLLASGVSESLAGRAVYLELGPLTSREVAGRTAQAPVLLDVLEGRIPEGTFDRLTRQSVALGGMPSVALQDADPDLWFQGFEHTYLERDVRSLARVPDLPQFRRFLRLVAHRTGSLASLSEIGRDAAVTSAVAGRYLGLLEASFTVHRLPPFLRSRVSRLVKSPKIYLADSGIATRLTRSRMATDPGDRLTGPLLETFVAQHLRALLGAWRPGATLGFWNIQGRHEVDLVIEEGDRCAAIEVKGAARWSDSDLCSLRRFLEVVPDCVAAVLACDTPRVVPLGDRLWAMPLGRLLA